MVKAEIPEGRPKSGRVWKTKQKTRTSAQNRRGVVAHMAKTFEEKERLRTEKERVLSLERELKEEKRQKLVEEKARREAQQKRRMENEYKNSVYQTLKPEKLKGMSKKQLRMVKKTAMNKNGQIELVDPFSGKSGSSTSAAKKKRK
jgi:rRNA-processing protein CGR1